MTVWDLLYNTCTTGFPLTELERWQYGASQNAFNFFQKQYLTPPLSRVCYKTKPKPSDSGRRRQRPRNSADLAASRKSGLLSFLSEPPIRDPLFSSLASLSYPSAALCGRDGGGGERGVGGNTTRLDKSADFRPGTLGQCTYEASWVVNS